jgi:hypothetical protein
MSKNLKFIWIDDDDRHKDAANLERQLKIKCPYVDVKPKDVDYLAEIENVKPDLILVDHNLIKIGAGDIRKGSTIAALIREKHPTYAIACITAQNINTIDSQQKSSYEAIFSYDEIKDHYVTMKSIATAYQKMKASTLKKVEDLFLLMKSPKEETIRLERILPHEIKENFKDPSIYGNVSKWVREVVMERPGFLYDRLWAATLLGLTESGFKKVESQFSAAKYKGIFADQSKERWWKSELINILSKIVKRPGLPWEKGHEIPGITNRHHSRDYYSDYKEEYPEVVAFLDETSTDRAAMKLKNTVPHPKYDKLLFFEEVRMMKAD